MSSAENQKSSPTKNEWLLKSISYEACGSENDTDNESETCDNDLEIIRKQLETLTKYLTQEETESQHQDIGTSNTGEEEVKRDWKEKLTLKPVVALLEALFNEVVKDIIAYLDRSVITLWISPCGREIISLLKTHKQDSETCYYLLPRVNYCTCNDYKRIVLNKEQKITCRHVAAVWLALTLNIVNTYNITEDKFNSIFNEFLNYKKGK